MRVYIMRFFVVVGEHTQTFEAGYIYGIYVGLNDCAVGCFLGDSRSWRFVHLLGTMYSTLPNDKKLYAAAD